MKRTIRKEFTLTRKEAEELRKKAKQTCRSEAAFVRDLVAGYEPKGAPGDEFYEAMDSIRNVSLTEDGGAPPYEYEVTAGETARVSIDFAKAEETREETAKAEKTPYKLEQKILETYD